jgi:diphthamide synthase (EF-2-diphthine--ammonia ligase)
MVASGLEATVVCVDPRRLDASFAGRRFDAAFLADLPPDVDPCGENGEFHVRHRRADVQAPLDVAVGTV